MADRMSQLSALANAVPGLNQQAQKQAQAARQVKLQQQLGGAAAATPVTRGAQALAAEQATAAGEIAAAGQQAQQQQLAAVGQQALGTQATTDQTRLRAQETAQREAQAGAEQRQGLALTREELAARKSVSQADIESARRVQKLGLEQDNRLSLLSNKQSRDLSRAGRDVKQEIFDSRIQFEKDELGRKFSNERQLADFAVTSSKSTAEFQDRARKAEQGSARKIQLMKVAQASVIRELEQASKMSEGAKQFEHQKELQSIRDALAEKIRREEARAKNNAAMWQAGGTIVGAVAGGVIGSVVPGAGTVVGASVGAAVGGGVGTMVGGAVS